MAPRVEEDYPVGHPGRFDYKPDSPEAKEWLRRNSNPLGERDYPVDHPKALDTPGNQNHVPVLPGVDPNKPELEAFTGRDPETAERMREINAQRATAAKESVLPPPVEAPPPPPPGDISIPHGQPDVKS